MENVVKTVAQKQARVYALYTQNYYLNLDCYTNRHVDLPNNVDHLLVNVLFVVQQFALELDALPDDLRDDPRDDLPDDPRDDLKLLKNINYKINVDKS